MTLRVVVVGDALLDVDLVGVARRLRPSNLESGWCSATSRSTPTGAR
jgi:hypothetical protein